MKTTLASLLVLNALSGAAAFTAPAPLAGTSLAAARPSTRLGLFGLKKNEEETATAVEDGVPSASDGAMSPEVTEMALEAKEEKSSAAVEEEEELSETQKLLQKVKQAGTAGAISYALWELGFWGISIPVCSIAYYQVAGHWPDFSNSEDMQKVGAEAFAFVNFARFAVPLRIGLALSTTPWIDENIVQKFLKKDGEEEGEE